MNLLLVVVLIYAMCNPETVCEMCQHTLNARKYSSKLNVISTILKISIQKNKSWVVYNSKRDEQLGMQSIPDLSESWTFYLPCVQYFPIMSPLSSSWCICSVPHTCVTYARHSAGFTCKATDVTLTEQLEMLVLASANSFMDFYFDWDTKRIWKK